MQNEVIELYLDDIIPNRFQPREKFEESALKELSASIKEHGVIQPIIVRKHGEKYEIIAGERRYKASALAGLTKIPAIIRNLDDKEASKVALLENLQRKDLTAIEEARTYQKILELDEMTQEQLGRTMGKSQAAIANKLRLLALADEVQEALLNDEISERHARSLLNLDNANEQVEMLNKIIRNRMTVRELDQTIKEMKRGEQTELPITTPKVEEVKPIQSAQNITPPVQSNPVVQQPQVNMQPQPPVQPTPMKVPTLEDLLRPQSEINKQNAQNQQEDVIESLDPQPVQQAPSSVSTVAPTSSNFIPNYNSAQSQTPQPTTQNNEFLEQFKLKDAINLVKNVVPNLQQKGMKVDMQEFDLGGKYQIIININKTE